MKRYRIYWRYAGSGGVFKNGPIARDRIYEAGSAEQALQAHLAVVSPLTTGNGYEFLLHRLDTDEIVAFRYPAQPQVERI